MEIYLVGGAVRDQLLDLPVKDRDWVVVGTTPDAMLQQGFKPIGKDFPVFLHPASKEEYALARVERKTGPGYTGFQFHTAPDVTLEQDLERRDLTMNAMAINNNDQLIDPFGGVQDIQARLLRHVSPAFSEDPVRILRVARFAARYHPLGFTVAEETMDLMHTMVSSGEVDHLVAERVWKEMEGALAEPSPHIFFETLRECGALARLVPEIENLYGVPQPPKHHPEIDCGVHTMMTVQQAASLSDNAQVRFAAVMHDLGKATTPKDILPSHYGHEQRGVELIKHLCERLAVPNDYRDLAVMVSAFHTHCHRSMELNAKTLLETLEQTDALRRPDRFQDFLSACEADARGRTGFENRQYPQAPYLMQALNLCQSIGIEQIDQQRYQGAQIGEQIRRLRLAALKEFRDRHGNDVKSLNR